MAGSASTSKVTYYFYANDGTFPDGSNIISFNKPDTAVFTISGHVDQPSRDNYIFLGWSTASNSSNVVYGMNDNCDGSYGYTYYAVWKVDDSHDKCIFEKGAIDILVDKIKNGGGGATIETVTVSVNTNCHVKAIDKDFNVISLDANSSAQIMKNTLLFAYGNSNYVDYSAGVLVFNIGYYSLLQATSDMTITQRKSGPV